MWNLRQSSFCVLFPSSVALRFRGGLVWKAFLRRARQCDFFRFLLEICLAGYARWIFSNRRKNDPSQHPQFYSFIGRRLIHATGDERKHLLIPPQIILVPQNGPTENCHVSQVFSSFFSNFISACFRLTVTAPPAWFWGRTDSGGSFCSPVFARRLCCAFLWYLPVRPFGWTRREGTDCRRKLEMFYMVWKSN